MSRKAMLMIGLCAAMMTGGCNWLSTAHQIAIHVMSVAAGVNGLNELFNLGL